ncbi:unnamed protein product, partial [Cladocopium goreaui]
MPAGLHDATQLAFPAGLCSVGKRVAGGGQFHLPWQEGRLETTGRSCARLRKSHAEGSLQHFRQYAAALVAMFASSWQTLDPDDPNIKGKNWEAVEKALRQRDAFAASLNGHDIDATEPRGPTFEEPCNPLYSTFPWEEKVDDFNKPASCSHKNWKHQCLKYKLGTQCATLQMDAGDGENGLNPAMLDAFQDAIMDLQDRSEVRVVILKSTGKFFSNGFDPKHLLAESSMSDEDIIAFQIQYAKILYFLQSLVAQSRGQLVTVAGNVSRIVQLPGEATRWAVWALPCQR